MNNTDLQTKIKDLIKKNRVIMIDGPWGCGKTYALNEYIKAQSFFNRKNIYYVSLFGIDNIKELNGTLFGKHSVSNIFERIKGDISVSFLNETVKANIKLDYVLKVKDKNNKGNGKTIILDDLERVNFNKIDIFDLLGYVERLVTSGFTIVIVANERALKDKELQIINEFSDKIIETKIRVDSCDDAVLEQQFSNMNVSLIGLHKYFDSNLRLALRVKNVYLNITDNLSKDKVDFDYNKLFEMCVKTVTGIYTNVGFEDYKKTNNEKDYVDLSRYFYQNNWINNELSERLNYILYRSDMWPNEENTSIIKGIAKYIYDGDMSILTEYYTNQTSVLFEDSFLYDDNKKEELYKESMKYILKGSCHNPRLVLIKIFRMIDEGYEHIVKNNLALLKTILSTKEYYDCIIKDKDIDSLYEQNTFFKDFINSLVKTYKEKHFEQIAFEIKNSFKKKDYKKACYICSCLINENNSEMPIEIIVRSFKENKYYLDNICITITSDYWDLTVYIACILRNTLYQEDYLKALDMLLENNPHNRSLKERVKYLKSKVQNQ